MDKGVLIGFFNWAKKEKTQVQVETQKTIYFSNFELVTNYIYKLSGITDLDKRILTLTRLQQFASQNDIYTTQEFLDYMKKSDDFIQEVLNIATVNETYFLREHTELEWLVKYITKQNRPLKILSMPCSSGEEVYTILLMLVMADLDISSIEIKGYDINSHAISLAKEGKYNEHSLHKLDAYIINKYFIYEDDHTYRINDQFKNNVNFEQKNIFDLKGIVGKYDIVLSRNMFIYFDDENKKNALDIIVNLLKKDGIYIKGHADNISKHDDLQSLEYGIYKKI